MSDEKTPEPPAPRRSVFPGLAAIERRPAPVVEALTALRRAGGRSQAELARLMGTSQPAVARLEAGAADARLSTLARYAAALDHELAFALRPREER